jgi:hypothetical protein
MNREKYTILELLKAEIKNKNSRNSLVNLSRYLKEKVK